MAKLWKVKRNLWTSKDWLQFVRSLPCCCQSSRCPNCEHGARVEHVEAHHIRYGAQVGMGRKSDDFMTIPLSAYAHHLVQRFAELTLLEQLRRMVDVWVLAQQVGFLRVHENAPPDAFFPDPGACAGVLPGRAMDIAAAHLRQAFEDGVVWLDDPSTAVMPDEIGWGAAG